MGVQAFKQTEMQQITYLKGYQVSILSKHTWFSSLAFFTFSNFFTVLGKHRHNYLLMFY